MNPQQEVLFSLLEKLMRLFDEMELRWFVADGTAVGAMRHAGFVPWDDDIDLAMPLPDFVRFRDAVDGGALAGIPGMAAVNVLRYPAVFSTEIKVHDPATMGTQVVLLPNPDAYMGVYVDVAPLVGVPEDPATDREFVRQLRALGSTMWERSVLGREDVSEVAGHWEVLLEQTPWESARFVRYAIPSCSSLDRPPFERVWFDAADSAPFESTTVRVPQGVEPYLTSLFGDWRTPPPPELRTGHQDVVFDTTRSAASYARSARADPLVAYAAHLASEKLELLRRIRRAEAHVSDLEERVGRQISGSAGE